MVMVFNTIDLFYSNLINTALDKKFNFFILLKEKVWKMCVKSIRFADTDSSKPNGTFENALSELV